MMFWEVVKTLMKRELLEENQCCWGGGDFMQILLVVPGGTRYEIVRASLSRSVLWPKFKVPTLKENIRLLDDGLSNNKMEELHEFAN
jgi:hypothetical protein